MNTDSLEFLRKMVCKFRDERNWRKYHKPKNLAISIAIEAAELLELFQWLSDDEIDKLVSSPKFISEISMEMADILMYLLSLADILGIDLGDSVIRKLGINEKKYPVEETKSDKIKERLLEEYK